ncbi:MAG: TetR/AcrR family transcriptional regulator [Acidobacteriota bacterium]
MTLAERPHARPARQQRSRRTLERLLDAAEGVLAEKGLDAATVPAIAARSGLSVGVVYRRFPDKDALIRAVYERFFARSRDKNRRVLEPGRWAGVATAPMVHALVGGMVKGYRLHRGLLAALLAYAETQPDRRFRRRARQLSEEVFGQIAILLLSRGRELTHPEPAKAIRFMLLVVGSALHALLLSAENPNPFGTGKRLTAELARLCLGFLGVPDAPAPGRVG